MAPTQAYPSMQSFYEREVPKSVETQEAVPGESIRQGDGFTEEELAAASDPLSRKWNPVREYEQCGIGELVPGPKAVTFVGRVVNFSTHFGSSPKEPKAAGWHHLILKDDSAAVSVCVSPINSNRATNALGGQIVFPSKRVPAQARPAPHHLDRFHL